MVDHPIDPHWVPHSDRAQEVIAEIIDCLQNHEHHFKLRQRKRRAADQVIFERSVTAIICDVVRRHLATPNDRVRLSLAHGDKSARSRYQPFSFGQTLRRDLEKMRAKEMGFIEVEWGGRFQETMESGQEVLRTLQTTVRVGPILLRWMEQQPFTRDDFRRDENEEVIILKAEKRWHSDKGEWLEYEDTQETNRWRRQLRQINAKIESAEIEYVGQLNVDTAKRRLRRFFNNGQFDQGGRLIGGFWIDLSGEDRRRNLRIDGEPVSELDFGQSTLRILYGNEVVEPEGEDLYQIQGYGYARDGIKKIINAALFSDKTQNQMPRGTRSIFGRKPKYAEVLAAIRQVHQPIAQHFFSGIGLNLMFRESQIMMDVLLSSQKMSERVVALPIHDSVLVPRSREEEMRELMLALFYGHTGVPGVVTVERAEPDPAA